MFGLSGLTACFFQLIYIIIPILCVFGIIFIISFIDKLSKSMEKIAVSVEKIANHLEKQ